MTKKQRAQVVELLRCAADIAVCGERDCALAFAAGRLDMRMMPFLVPHLKDGHWSNLIDHGPVRNHFDWLVCGDGYEFCLLEAAQRVEEGTWP